MRGLSVLLDVPIRFDVGDTVTHAPMVDIQVAGQPTRLILDTGSTDHVLTVELVRAAGLPHEPGEPGTDHAGASVESWSVGDVPADIDGVGFVLNDVVAITGPGSFEGWGVGGFLSPQHLHPTAYVVIDLAAHRFLLVDPGVTGDTDGTLGTWLRSRSPTCTTLQMPRARDEATPVVRAAIEPFGPVAAMLNTGGRGTEFATAAVPGLVGTSPGQLGYGVGGSPVVGMVVDRRTLMVGDVRLPVQRLLIRDAIDTMQGLIGMDVLDGTILAVASDRERPVFWSVPSRHP